MYQPKHFEESRVEVLHDLIRAHPLATLVTLSSNGLVANHIPLQFVSGSSSLGTLQGHVARANPLWKDFDENLEVLTIFQGADTYISPSWYATKHETGKVVPTWNHTVVHAHGTLRIIDDANWLRAQIESLTTQNEAAFPQPWAVTAARLHRHDDFGNCRHRDHDYPTLREMESEPEPAVSESDERDRSAAQKRRRWQQDDG